MDPDLFCLVGESLFGARWQTAMADELGVNSRTIRRWVSGDNAVPESVQKELLEICEERQQVWPELIKRLSR